MAVSFSANAKAELCKNFPAKQCCALAECFGILLFCNSFGNDGIRIYGASSRQYFEVSTKGTKLKYRLVGLPEGSGNTSTTGDVYVDNGVLKVRK